MSIFRGKKKEATFALSLSVVPAGIEPVTQGFSVTALPTELLGTIVIVSGCKGKGNF